MNMEPMSFWQLIKNSPEWVGVFANALFAVVTIGVVTWQVYVMKSQVRVMVWQARSSARHELIQNRLIRLQHEHEWVLRKNEQREQLLMLGRKLHVDLAVLQNQPEPTGTDGAMETIWGDMKDIMYELDSRLRILDLATFSGVYDKWFFTLKDYVEAVVKIVIADPGWVPSDQTKKAFRDADQQYNPIGIFLDLEAAIRMEFLDFKTKWDAALLS